MSRLHEAVEFLLGHLHKHTDPAIVKLAQEHSAAVKAEREESEDSGKLKKTIVDIGAKPSDPLKPTETVKPVDPPKLEPEKK